MIRRSADRATRASGFTLLEIAITLGILGVVIAVVYGVFAETLASKEHTETRADEFGTARTALNRIVADLQSVHFTPAAPLAPFGRGSMPQPTPTPPAGNPVLFAAGRDLFLGRPHTSGGFAIDDLAFSAFVRRPSAATFSAVDLGTVHYFVDAMSPDSPRLALYRQALYSLTGDAFDPDKPDLASSVILAEDVIGIEFTFFDGKDWQHEWNSLDTRNFGPAPQAVEITLTVARDRGPEVYRTAVDLPMARPQTTTQVAKPPAPTGGR